MSNSEPPLTDEAEQDTHPSESGELCPTFSEVINSDFIERALQSKANLYRYKWLRMVEKAGILDKSIDDAAAIKAATWTRSFNLSAGIASVVWLGYRKVRWSWAIIALIFAYVELLPWMLHAAQVPPNLEDQITLVAGSILFLFLGSFGDGWLLATLMRERALNRSTIVVHRSPARLVFVLLLVIAAMAIDTAIQVSQSHGG